MEEYRSSGRGSYIWGRSVHNTRIEHLWYDVTHGFGQKWKNFFTNLETNHRLSPNNPAHIWLLHHLFLGAINQDAAEWVHMWNNHVLQVKNGPNRSPRDMFFFSFPEDGARGLFDQPPEPDLSEEVGDISQYGVDWEVADNNAIMEHMLDNNKDEWQADNPFAPSTSAQPGQLSQVVCDAPGCPLSPFEVQELNIRLVATEDTASRVMAVQRKVWITAYELCEEIMGRPGCNMWMNSVHG
ncbi:hypothetical protein L226DRAFT_472992 [Lentinus tigrinus ALCF2SS1-7]|uniref:uncharacterized protein n=1 Tax=Lentinus tigrinus ALCF2SS1-7 TaxID=1328758 RepID=UPI0011661D5A|nr:hypothetical protein L226DRAFT_472992 [Lentinus tigrinus ALCF2SS1-7]